MTTPMLLSHCTLTGVDDSVDLQELIRVDRPIAEWGFLYSPKRQGLPGRYPSVALLQRAFHDLPPSVRVALHVCGNGVFDLLAGDRVASELVALVAQRHGRVQLNFNQEKQPIDLASLQRLIGAFPTLTVITQHNKANESIWSELAAGGHNNHAVLFDASGGRGVLETDWPQPLPGVRCGYAGGLGRDNLNEQLERIATIVGEQPVWVDMESSLRVKDAGGTDWLNLARCQDCLEITSARMLRDASVAPGEHAEPRPSSLLRGSPA